MKEVYVGRPSAFGNPFRQTQAERADRSLHWSDDGCVTKYRRWLNQQRLDRGPAWVALERLALETLEEPVVLKCPGCPTGDPNCHARVIENAIAWLNGKVH